VVSKNFISIDGKNEPAGFHATTIAGEFCVIRWWSINAEELQFSVWWKFDIAAHPKAHYPHCTVEYFAENGLNTKPAHYPKFIGAIVSGWLERRTGKFIQGEGSRNLLDTYIRKGERAILEALPIPTPLGFKAEGKFFP
jgi:hypothetical protein